MTDTPLCPTVCETLVGLRAGSLSAQGVLDACFARFHAREAAVGAWETIDEAAARRIAGMNLVGPLAGLPVGVKDIIDTVDLPTGYGSKAFVGHRPDADAACVAALRYAGAVVLGKTVSTEFASMHPGRTRNPHDLQHTPGGSSSGSAAAVADGMVPVALGTQTAGSVIRPGSFCGVVAYKGSYGWTDTAGIHPLAPSFDTLGFYARTVADIAPVRAALARDARNRVTARKPVIGLCRTPQWDQAGPGTKRVVEGAFEKLRVAGATVFEVVCPPSWDRLVETHRRFMLREMPAVFEKIIAAHGGKISQGFKDQVAEGASISAREAAVLAQEIADRRADFARMIGRGEIWLTPAAPDEAPRGIERTGDPLFNRLWTLLGGPLMSIPAGKGARGLPIGVQLVGAPGTDDDLLDAAAWVEAALEHA
ncbi:MAG: amidase [Alphaproteobacteria bacterium]|nr:amidase [Alphaproteobacteria bacterium]MCW5742451.1 amidase [Alphaproteobacteria bacterium]